jgi:hypothetical protein
MSTTEVAVLLGAVATLFGSISMLFVLGYLILLLRHNRILQRSMQSSTYQSLQQNAAAHIALMVNHPEIDQVIYKEESDKNLTGISAYWATLLELTFMENLCVQRKDFHLISDMLWDKWETYIRHDLQTYSFLRKVLNENKEMFAYLGELVTKL